MQSERKPSKATSLDYGSHQALQLHASPCKTLPLTRALLTHIPEDPRSHSHTLWRKHFRGPRGEIRLETRQNQQLRELAFYRRLSPQTAVLLACRAKKPYTEAMQCSPLVISPALAPPQYILPCTLALRLNCSPLLRFTYRASDERAT